MATVQKITPCLWFDNRAEEAAGFYVSVFANSEVLDVSKLDGETGGAIVSFDLEGQTFTALDGGPAYAFSPAVSFIVGCETQNEIDHFWDALSDGGSEGRCGWLEDRFGVSWQVIPSSLPALMQGNAPKVMDELLKMGKIDLETLRRASGS